jgi:hypothetical protein
VTKLQKRVKSGEPLLNISESTDFGWDSLLILTPYSQPENIEQRFKIDLSKTKHSNIEMRDDINQLIFFGGGKPVRMIEYPRYPGDFADNKVEFVKRNDAIFEVLVTNEKTSDGNKWIKLKRR